MSSVASWFSPSVFKGSSSNSTSASSTVKLNSSAGGTIVLRVNDASYICTSLQLKMAINEIPTATVVVGCGTPLNTASTKTYVSAEALLTKVLSRKDKAYTDMVECEIYEVISVIGDKNITQKKTKIFEGLIATGSVQYETGDRTIRAIKFVCMHKVCKLYAQPLSSYVNISTAELIDSVENKLGFNHTLAARSNSVVDKDGAVDVTKILEHIKGVENYKLDKIMAYITDAVIASNSYIDPALKIDGTISNIQDYLFSKYYINSDLGDDSKQAYIKRGCEYIMSSMQNSSIYETLVNVFVSNVFMLNFIPRWKDYDFKIEVQPSSSWTGKSSLTIPCSKVIGASSDINPINCINTPEAFVVSFMPEIDTAKGETAAGYDGPYGVFSTNEAVMQHLKKRYRDNDKSLDSPASTNIRAIMQVVPEWLQPAIIGKSLTTVNTNRHSKNTPATTPKTIKDKNSNNAVDLVISNAYPIADKIAEALFSYIYGTEDRVSVNLLISSRFGYDSSIGCLENSLGKIIDVTFEKDSNTGTATSPMDIRGVLSSITYTYTGTSSSDASYSIGLTCVRDIEDSTTIDCTLYSKDSNGSDDDDDSEYYEDDDSTLDDWSI